MSFEAPPREYVSSEILVVEPRPPGRREEIIAGILENYESYEQCEPTWTDEQARTGLYENIQALCEKLADLDGTVDPPADAEELCRLSRLLREQRYKIEILLEALTKEESIRDEADIDFGGELQRFIEKLRDVPKDRSTAVTDPTE